MVLAGSLGCFRSVLLLLSPYIPASTSLSYVLLVYELAA
jgi:hypothetical protein